MDLDPRLLVREEQVTGPARRLLGDDGALVTRFTVAPLDGPSANPTTLGLSDVRGTATGRDGTRPFRLVRKVIHDVELPWLPREGYSAGQDDWNYWKREVLAFESGLLTDLGGVSPVRCLGTTDHGDWAEMWLERLEDDGEQTWPVRDLVASAGALGELSGHCAARPPSKHEHPWLLVDLLPGWLATMHLIGLDRAVADDDVWRAPDLHGAFPAPLGRRIGALVQDAPALLAAGRLLPTTLTHHDAGRRNLFREQRAGARDWRLLDWSLVGLAPVGQDLGHAVGLNAFYLDVPADRTLLDEYEAAAGDAYVEGLRRNGVDVPPALVRGYARTVAAAEIVTFGAVLAAGLRPPGGSQNEEYDTWPQDWAAERGVDVDVLVHRWATALGWLLDLADRARDDLAAF